MKQEMMRCQWHQPDYMQIICTSLQTDNQASAPSPQAAYSSRCSTNSVKAQKAKVSA